MRYHTRLVILTCLVSVTGLWSQDEEKVRQQFRELRAKAAALDEAGKPEEAERVREKAKELQRGRKETKKAERPNQPPPPPPPPRGDERREPGQDLRNEIRKLKEQAAKDLEVEKQKFLIALDEKEQAVIALNRRISSTLDTLTQNANRADAEKKALTDQLLEKERNLNGLKAQAIKLEGERQKLKASLEEKEASVEELNKRVTANRDILNDVQRENGMLAQKLREHEINLQKYKHYAKHEGPEGQLKQPGPDNFPTKQPGPEGRPGGEKRPGPDNLPPKRRGPEGGPGEKRPGPDNLPSKRPGPDGPPRREGERGAPNPLPPKRVSPEGQLQRDERRREPGNPLVARLRHFRVAADHLKQAGAHELAKDLTMKADAMEQEVRQMQRGPDREHDEQLNALRDENERLRQELRRMRERQKD